MNIFALTCGECHFLIPDPNNAAGFLCRRHPKTVSLHLVPPDQEQEPRPATSRLALPVDMGARGKVRQIVALQGNPGEGRDSPACGDFREAKTGRDYWTCYRENANRDREVKTAA